MKKKNRKSILLLIILFLFILGNFALEGKITEPISNFLKDWTSPFFQIRKGTLNHKETYSMIASSKEKELRKEIEELKKVLSLNQTLEEATYVNATTIYRNIESWNQEITVDKGKKEGIQIGMPAVTSDGLLGRVSKVGDDTSTITLLCTDQKNKISVKIAVGENYIYGLLNGYDQKRNLFSIEGISDNEEIPEGSIVTTTGMGAFYPAGVFIGTTSNIHKDHFDLSKIVEVKSYVNFQDLSIVTILKRNDTL